jgi:hypothetical protein
MSMDRRDFFKFAGGSAVGLVFTPVPWTLLNDTAKWSQNWSWIPRPRDGEIRTKFTNCTLCRAGCGVRARCVGDQPVGLAGVAAHPASRGALCPIGLAAHHQAYHPLRLTQGTRRGKPVAVDEAVVAVQSAIAAGKGRVALLDLDPGRAASAIYKQFAEKVQGGVYLAPEPAEGATLRALAERFEKPFGPLGLDLENARTILSFSTPILDGWGTPGRVLKQRGNFRLIQVEAEASRTASLADVWLPIRPGTEAAVALGIANVVTREKLCDPACVCRATDCREYLELIAKYTPESVAEISGVPAERIVETARYLARQDPPIAIGDGDPTAAPMSEDAVRAIAGLNLLFGSVCWNGGVMPRRGQTLNGTAEVEDGSIGVVIAVGAFPWRQMERKLGPHALVVNLSPWPDARADYVVPAPVAMESLRDVPAPFDAKEETLSLAAPLTQPPAGVMTPAEFLARLEPSTGKVEDAVNARVAAVHKTRRGSVISYKDGTSTPLENLATAGDLAKSLLAGAIWVDSPVKDATVPPFSFLRKGRGVSAGGPYGWRGVKGLGVSPVLSKLYQESGLRNPQEA